MNCGLVQKTLSQKKMIKKGSIIVILILQIMINLKRIMNMCSNYLQKVQKSKLINFSNFQKIKNEFKSKKEKKNNFTSRT